MEIREYSIESLEGELRGYEDRFGLSSETFFGIYRSEECPADILGFEGFVWADTYEELSRLRAGVTGRLTQLAQ